MKKLTFSTHGDFLMMLLVVCFLILIFIPTKPISVVFGVEESPTINNELSGDRIFTGAENYGQAILILEKEIIKLKEEIKCLKQWENLS